MTRALLILWALLTAACSGPESSRDSITTESLMKHIRVLASDDFEGRAPASKGEELTAAYLTEEFRAMGLQPGNPDGTYVQQVPLVGFTARTEGSFQTAAGRLGLTPNEDFVAVSRRNMPLVEVKNSDVVFVGYGVTAPEYQWDDYKGMDVRGKTLLMLINDPAVADPADPKRLDEKLFRGPAMTYYGRWTYKYEIASEKGAAAAIIIHETGPAGYPFSVVTGSWGTENFDIRQPGGKTDRVPVESWISSEKARELLKSSGLDFDKLKAAAARRDFRPVALKARASFRVQNTFREVESKNVIARLEGSDPVLREEHLIYVAHWDHLGRDTSLEGDQIYNGALDNATGTAGLLEIARAFAQARPRPVRSILFLAVTAEEKGLLGAKYYAENPLYPLARNLACINMDGLNVWGRTRDMVVVGLGQSTLDDIAAEIAKVKGRTLKPDAEPEKGFFYRSDHFEFAKQGVPSFYPGSGTDYIGQSAEYGRRKREEYTERDYHKVTDEIKADWDLSGAAEDVRLLFELGKRVAAASAYPEWKAGSEFKEKREAMLR